MGTSPGTLWYALAFALLLCQHQAVGSGEQEKTATKIAFFKTHKTGSSTFGSVLARAAAVHGLSVYPPFGHYVEPARVHKGFTAGSSNIVLQHIWQHNSKSHRVQDWFTGLVMNFYSRALGPEFELFATIREPVSLWLSFFYYFIQPGVKATLEKGLEERMGANRLAKDFELRKYSEVLAFIKSDTFKRVVFVPTEKMDFVLAYMCIKYGWQKSDVLYMRTNVNEGTRPRWKGDKVVAQRPPSVSELSDATLLKIQEMNYLDMLLYGAALTQYLNWEARVLQEHPEISAWVEEFKCLRSNIPACSEDSPSGWCTWLGMEDLVYEAMFLNMQGLANVTSPIPDSKVIIADAIKEVQDYAAQATACRSNS